MKGEELKSERQVNVGHEAGYLKVIYPEFLEAGWCREISHGASTELNIELAIVLQADLKSFDRGK